MISSTSSYAAFTASNGVDACDDFLDALLFTVAKARLKRVCPCARALPHVMGEFEIAKG
jgi:hypothetical protein